MYVKPDRDGCCFWVGVIILALGAVAVLAVGGFAQGVPGHNTSDPSCKYYCPPGQKCPTTPAWTQPGTFKSGISKTFVRPESPPARRPVLDSAADTTLEPATVQTICRVGTTTKRGTGVVIAILESTPRLGAVLATAHTLARSGDVTIRLGDSVIPAKVVDQDGLLDIALLTFEAPPNVSYMPLAAKDPGKGTAMVWEGFTPSGRLRFRGPVVGYEGSEIGVAGQVVEGMSGGPMYSPGLGLVSIITTGWPRERPRYVAGPALSWIRKFLGRGDYKWALLGCSTPSQNPKPPERLPLVTVKPIGPPAVPLTEVESPPAETETPPTDDVIDSLRDPLIGLRDRINQQEAVTATGQTSTAIAEIQRKVEERLTGSVAQTLLPGLLAGLGWTGPPALAAIVGLKVLSALIGRARTQRRKRGSREAVVTASAFPGPEPAGSLPRDDTEAAQFIRLSQLEGRSPLHDALIGRIAFDELDKAIDTEPDGPAADWARKLRRQLEDRFNEMAPPAVFAAAGKTT